MKTKAIVLLAAVFMVAALFGGMVYAAPPVKERDYTDPDVVWQLLVDLNAASDYTEAFDDLSTEAQEAVMSAMKGTSEAVNYSLAHHTGCDTQVVQVHKRNSFGWIFATYESSTRWCWDGDEILGVPVFRTTGRIAWWAREAWKYAGNWYKEEDMDYPDKWWHADRARGHFKECFPIVTPRLPTVWVCFDSNFSPIINKWQYGDGTYRHETG